MVNAKTDDQRVGIQSELLSNENQAVSRKELSKLLAGTVEQNQVPLGSVGDFLGFSNNNITLKKTESADFSSLIAGSLPLSQNDQQRQRQVQGLQGLTNSGNRFDIADLTAKTVLSLNLFGEDLEHFNKLAQNEKEELAKNVAARLLSSEAISKETENVKQFGSALLRVDNQLSKLQTSVAFSGSIQNIQNQGTRGIALAGAKDSLSALSEFLSPESKTRLGTQVQRGDIENEFQTKLEDASLKFISGLNNLPDEIKKSLKIPDTIGDNDQPQGTGYGSNRYLIVWLNFGRIH